MPVPTFPGFADSFVQENILQYKPSLFQSKVVIVRHDSAECISLTSYLPEMSNAQGKGIFSDGSTLSHTVTYWHTCAVHLLFFIFTFGSALVHSDELSGTRLASLE